MDVAKVQQTVISFMNKYKFVALILIIGILLMLYPGKKKNTKSSVMPVENTTKSISVCEELTEIVQNIKGVGKAKIMLTVAAGEETIFQVNADSSQSTDSVSQRNDTVIITDDARNQNGLVRQTIPPRYLGAIVICDGADNSVVKLAVIDAVSKITGLKSDCISVLKMK